MPPPSDEPQDNDTMKLPLFTSALALGVLLFICSQVMSPTHSPAPRVTAGETSSTQARLPQPVVAAAEPAVISETLRTLIDEFYIRMARRGEAWTQAVVSFHRDGNSVGFKTSFTRPATAPPVTTTAEGERQASPRPRNSWLKFWQQALRSVDRVRPRAGGRWRPP